MAERTLDPKGGHGSLHTITIGRNLTRPRGPDPDDPPGHMEGDGRMA